MVNTNAKKGPKTIPKTSGMLIMKEAVSSAACSAAHVVSTSVQHKPLHNLPIKYADDTLFDTAITPQSEKKPKHLRVCSKVLTN
eukprot:CAMPEP_0203792178 /NCGR_PEP_ID=MMETSP0100_2-20121128/5092_1 /ASSEMBLY_ACC=CAM_ASM_000210 /TAXON_ID=96639 /ORGANISM=" , Strain NY0313808BC1" /LENGTH=83 /DNA_ID=CAMNT_0050695671 /DNA_START=663 /DNA_END=915 /DNA_ORIENTATION=-